MTAGPPPLPAGSSPGMEADEYLTICRRLLSDFAGQEAGRAGVVWGKIKGYPLWPAQLLRDEVVAGLPELGRRPAKEGVVPLMFFGDRTVAWVSGRLARFGAAKCDWTVCGGVGWVGLLLRWAAPAAPVKS